jgi:DUF1009 family protein
MARRLTLIAGSGSLVPLVVAAARRRGDVLQAIDIVGRGDLEADAVKQIPLAQASELVEAVKGFRTSHIVLAGSVQISDADREAVARALGLVGRLAGSLGDIGFAAMILLYCRVIGVKIVAVQDVAPDLLAPNETIAGPALGGAATASARLALSAARAIGAIDLGQSIVFAGDRPVAAEDAEGTDALLRRVAALKGSGLTGNGSAPLILAKALKPRQPKYADLPAIGAQTIRNASSAGVSIVAVEAGRSLILDRAELIAEADARKVSVIGLRVDND